MRVLDLGCGTGELTALAHRELLAKATLGIDASAAMLERAAKLAAPGLRFEQRRVEDFSASRAFDLVLSNAALHWVDDHPALFERMLGWLAPGGQIAVQMPANDDHVSQRTARELAAEAPYAAELGRGPAREPAALARGVFAAVCRGSASRNSAYAPRSTCTGCRTRLGYSNGSKAASSPGTRRDSGPSRSRASVRTTASACWSAWITRKTIPIF